MYQVYRLTPVFGRYYEYTEADTVTCVYPNQIYTTGLCRTIYKKK